MKRGIKDFADNGGTFDNPPPEPPEYTNGVHHDEPPVASLTRLKTQILEDVKAEKILWLWKPLIAFGTFTLVDGEEGIGKSTVTLAIAKAVACGKGYDDIEGFEMIDTAPRFVLLLSAEESLSFSVKPRLVALEADCSRIVAVDEPFVFDETGFLRLEMLISEYEPSLIIIDPLFAYTGDTKLNDDGSIRKVTKRLSEIAETWKCAILGVRHIGKTKGFGDARAAGLNGVGWRASARSALLVGRDSESGELAVCQTKTNLGLKFDKAFGFKIESSSIEIETGEVIEVGKFTWTGISNLTAAQMLSNPKEIEERIEESDAISFLRDALTSGKREAGEVKKEAFKSGFTERNVRTARGKLNVIAEQEGFAKEKVWYWSLPSLDTSLDTNSTKRQMSVNSNDNASYGNNLSSFDVDKNKCQVKSSEVSSESDDNPDIEFK